MPSTTGSCVTISTRRTAAVGGSSGARRGRDGGRRDGAGERRRGLGLGGAAGRKRRRKKDIGRLNATVPGQRPSSPVALYRSGYTARRQERRHEVVVDPDAVAFALGQHAENAREGGMPAMKTSSGMQGISRRRVLAGAGGGAGALLAGACAPGQARAGGAGAGSGSKLAGLVRVLAALADRAADPRGAHRLEAADGRLQRQGGPPESPDLDPVRQPSRRRCRPPSPGAPRRTAGRPTSCGSRCGAPRASPPRSTT